MNFLTSFLFALLISFFFVIVPASPSFAASSTKHKPLSKKKIVRLKCLLYKLTKDQKAASFCLQALKNNPNDLTARAVLGTIRMAQHDWKKVVINFTILLKAAHRDKNSDLLGQSYLLRGLAYSRQGNMHKALQDYTAGEKICHKIANYPCLIQIRTAISGILVKRGDFDRAEVILNKNISLARKTYHPKEEATALFALGTIKMRKREMSQGCQLFRQSEKIAKKNKQKKLVSALDLLLMLQCKKSMNNTL